MFALEWSVTKPFNHIPDIVPPNEAIPVKCYQQKDGNLMAEFVTRTSGVFKIEVMDNGRPIVGSPFQCLSYDPARVRLLGIARYTIATPSRFYFIWAETHAKSSGKRSTWYQLDSLHFEITKIDLILHTYQVCDCIKYLGIAFQGRGSSGGPGDQFPGWADGRWFRRVGRNGDLSFGWRTPPGDQTSGQRGKKTNLFSSGEDINFPHRQSRHLVGEKGNVTLFSNITVSWPSERLCQNNTKSSLISRFVFF